MVFSDARHRVEEPGAAQVLVSEQSIQPVPPQAAEAVLLSDLQQFQLTLVAETCPLLGLSPSLELVVKVTELLQHLGFPENGVALLVGRANSGKTTVVRCLQRGLGDWWKGKRDEVRWDDFGDAESIAELNRMEIAPYHLPRRGCPPEKESLLSPGVEKPIPIESFSPPRDNKDWESGSHWEPDPQSLLSLEGEKPTPIEGFSPPRDNKDWESSGSQTQAQPSASQKVDMQSDLFSSYVGEPSLTIANHAAIASLLKEPPGRGRRPHTLEQLLFGADGPYASSARASVQKSCSTRFLLLDGPCDSELIDACLAVKDLSNNKIVLETDVLKNFSPRALTECGLVFCGFSSTEDQGHAASGSGIGSSGRYLSPSIWNAGGEGVGHQADGTRGIADVDSMIPIPVELHVLSCSDRRRIEVHARTVYEKICSSVGQTFSYLENQNTMNHASKSTHPDEDLILAKTLRARPHK